MCIQEELYVIWEFTLARFQSQVMNRPIQILFVVDVIRDFWLGHLQSALGRLYNGRSETTV